MGRVWRSAVAVATLAIGCGSPTAPDPVLEPGLPYLVKDIGLRVSDGNPFELTDVDGTLFFVASHDDHGREIWRSDGTEAGTRLVADINPSTSTYTACRCYVPAPSHLARIGDRLFFVGDDGVHGHEPWTSDGTEVGTRMVRDLAPGPEASLLTGIGVTFVDLGGRAAFSALHDEGFEPWVSDGTYQGTELIADIRPGRYGSSPGIWSVGGRLYLTADDGVHGVQPWTSDGTPSGTTMLRDLGHSRFRLFDQFTLFSRTGLVYFTTEGQLWRTSGTARGTWVVDQATSVAAALYGRLILRGSDPATGVELWATDGTVDGAQVLRDIWPGPQASRTAEVTAFPTLGFAVFTADDGEHGSEVWRTDGTPDGTYMLRDLNPGRLGSSAGNYVLAGGRVYFTAPGAPCALWSTDGTPEGTRTVAGTEGLCPRAPVASGRHLFFHAFVSGLGSELWAIELR